MKKRIVTFVLMLAAALALVACSGPEIREADPVLKGVVSKIEIEQGDAFNPLAGITADDGNGKDITSSIKHTFKTEWLNQPGTYTYRVTVENAAGKSAFAEVTLIVGQASLDVLVAPSAITYYIGSKTFNPLEEVRAYNPNTGEEVEVIVEEEEYSTSVPGTYSYVVAVKDSAVANKKSITLTVKAKYDIPAELTKDPIVIDFWHSNGDSINTALVGYARAFETEMKAKGYNITVNVIKNGANYDELRTNVVNAIKGGSLPHLVQNYPDHVVEYNANGAIASLTPYIQSTIHGFGVGSNNDSFLDILESYRSENRATNLIGDYLSLPLNKSTEVAAYNKDFFDYILDGRPFPETWQDLFELMPEITAYKDEYIDKVALRWQAAGKPLTSDEIAKIKADFVPFVYDSVDNAFITLARQFGGQYTSRDQTKGTGIIEFGKSPQVVDMLEFFGEHRNVAFTVPAYWEAKYTNEVSKKGQAVFGVGSTGGVRYNTPEENGFKLYNIGVAPVPYDKYSPSSRTVIQQGTNISITTKGTDQEKLAAWYFLKYLTSTETQSDFGIKTGYSPVRDSSYTTPEYLAYLALAETEIKDSAALESLTAAKYREKFELIVKAMGSKAAAEQRQYGFYDEPFIGSSAARSAVGTAFQRVILAAPDANLATEIKNALAAAVAEAEKVIVN